MAINIDELQIQIGIEASKAASGIKQLASNLRNVKSDAQGASSALKDAAQGVKDLGTSTSEASETVKDADKKSVSALARIAEAAKSAAPKLKAVASGAKGVGVSVATHLGKALASPFVSFSKSVGNAVSRITTLFSAIKRIAMYRLIRSAIKLMTQAISEGIKTLIAWDREWGNNTSGAAKTADEITAKWGEVKKAFGAAAMPLIQILQPALMAVMNTVINVVNGINQVFRTFQGYGTYMKATLGAVEAGTKAATGAAKELQRVLFGFDELNVLPSKTASGSGSTDATAGQFDYIETKINLPFEIDTSGKNIGEKIALMLNNALKRFDASAFGRDLAEKINFAIDNAHGFFANFSFTGLGEKIATGLSETINNIHWRELGSTIANRLLALPRLAIGFINKFDFSGLGTAIFNGLDSLIDTLNNALENFDAYGTGKALGRGVVDLVTNLKVGTIVNKVAKLLVNVFKKAIALASGVIVGLFKGFIMDLPDLLEGVLVKSNEYSKSAMGDLQQYISDTGYVYDSSLDKFVKKTKETSEQSKSQIQTTASEISNVINIAAENAARCPITPVVNSQPAKTEVVNTQMWLTTNPLRPSVVNPTINTTPAKTEVSNTQTWLNKNPLKTIISAPVAGLASGLGLTLSKLQIALNNNPLAIALTVAGQTVGAKAASIVSSAFNSVRGALGTVLGFANGGIPDIGTLFYAGEAGAEIVATGRSGQTGVMNMQQMQEAVASGNMEVVNALYAVANMLGNEIRSKDNNVYLDGDKIGQSVSRYQYNQARRGISYQGV